jgi:hypothetical protein
MSADSQRLDSVRRRRRSRRMRWVRTVSALGIGTGLIALGWLVAPRLSGLLLPALGQGVAALRPAAWRIADTNGEARGWVATIDRDTRIMQVASGFLGLKSIALLVTPGTLIVVGDKEGGFGDIRQGQRVVVSYQVRRGALEAQRVEMLGERSVETSRPASGQP